METFHFFSCRDIKMTIMTSYFRIRDDVSAILSPPPPRPVPIGSSHGYTLQFVGYDFIETFWLISHRFEIHTVTKKSVRQIASCNPSLRQTYTMTYTMKFIGHDSIQSFSLSHSHLFIFLIVFGIIKKSMNEDRTLQKFTKRYWVNVPSTLLSLSNITALENRYSIDKYGASS